MNAETASLFKRCMSALARERSYIQFEHEQVLASTRDERMRRVLSDIHIGRLSAVDACIAGLQRAFAEHASGI